jgi:hypothetical protein
MTDKIEIAKQLQTMLAEHLFGPKRWPIDDNHAVHQQLLDWGLIEHGEFGFQSSALGVELGVNEWTDFVGHHELSEIPHRLADCGLLTEEEADHIIFNRWESDGEKLEDILPPVLRRAYRAMYGSVS